MSKTVEELELQITQEMGTIRLNILEEAARAQRREQDTLKFRKDVRDQFKALDAKLDRIIRHLGIED